MEWLRNRLVFMTALVTLTSAVLMLASHHGDEIVLYHASAPSFGPSKVAAICMECKGLCPPSNDAGNQVCCGATFEVLDKEHVAGSFQGGPGGLIEVMPDRNYVIKTYHIIGGDTCVETTLQLGRATSYCSAWKQVPRDKTEWRTLETTRLQSDHVYRIECSESSCQFKELSGSYQDYLRKHHAYGKARGMD